MKSTIIFVITSLLAVLYLIILVRILGFLLDGMEFKERLALGSVGAIFAMALTAILAGTTYAYLQKKYDRQEFDKYH